MEMPIHAVCVDHDFEGNTMTTPAGWYDDGSGRQRWWDGMQWTEHFAPVAEAPAAESAVEATPADAAAEASSTEHDLDATHDRATAETSTGSAAEAETADSIQSVAAVESQSWNTPAPTDAADDTVGQSASQAPADEAAAPEVAPPDAAPAWAASESPAATPADSAVESAPQQDFVAPGAAGPTAPLDGDVPPYANAAPSYPAAAPSYPGAAPSYPGAAPAQPGAYPTAPGYPAAAPSYPGAAAYAPAGQNYGAPGGYPPAYGAAAPAAPAGISIVGIVGLGLAALGTLLACIPVTFVFGWILLAAGFIVSLISLFLKGKKWPGITGLILSVVGTIIAVIVAIVFAVASVADAVDDLPTGSPSSGTEDGTDTPEVVEGELGAPVTIEQLSGTSEVTINSAKWATTDGSSIESTNGGYVILDVTFEGISGTSYVNPFYFSIETAEGAEGTYDYYVDGIVAEELAAGDTITGTITFDVAQSESYEIIFTDELLEEVARISITPSAG